MKTFLTGGTGYIGHRLTQALVRRGWDVTVLVRRPDSPQARALERMGARLAEGDITDRESLRGGMAGADLVVHNAAWYELGLHADARPKMQAINVGGTENVLGLALELGVRRNVYVSSTTYWGNTGPIVRDETYRREHPYHLFYEQTKAEAHELALDYQQRGLPLIIVCPANVMGPNDHAVWGYFLRMYLNRWLPPTAWSKDTLNSGVHVDDVASGIALAAERGGIGETYLLSGDPISLGDVMGIWMTQPGGLKVRAYLPSWLAWLMFAPVEPLQRMAGLPAFISRETVAGGRMHSAFSSRKAQTELGWKYLPAQDMWLSIIQEERRLLAERGKRDIVSRLKPLDTHP